jgi:hypothetical protein
MTPTLFVFLLLVIGRAPVIVALIGAVQESLVRNLQNESLAHQVILDAEFQLTHQSTQGSGGAMQRQVRFAFSKIRKAL